MQVTTVFEHEVSVRWRDVDGLGHVNHAVFLTYLEEGRDAFYMQALGRDPHYVVARVEIDMRAEIRYADRRLQVRIEVERVGTTSLTTRETILTPAGESAAEARVVTVLWDADARKPMAFAADERDAAGRVPIIRAQDEERLIRRGSVAFPEPAAQPESSERTRAVGCDHRRCDC